jgi:hypothetical protein
MKFGAPVFFTRERILVVSDGTIADAGAVRATSAARAQIVASSKVRASPDLMVSLTFPEQG